LEYNLISHSLDSPLKLYNHIEQVVKATQYLVSQKVLNFSGISKKQIEELSVLVAVCHDFGKSTSFFQEYIQSIIEDKKYKGNEKDKSHSLISAFFGWFVIEKWLLKESVERHWKNFLPFAVFVAIEGHHGVYKSIEEILNTIDNNLHLLKKQLKAVNLEIFDYTFFEGKLSDGKDFNIKIVDSITSKIRKLNRNYRNKYSLEIQIEHRILALFIYSILLEADKAYLASDDPKQYEREPIDIPNNLIDEYLKRKKKNKAIDNERNKAYNETIDGVTKFHLNERIHSITLPTGLGKTLLSASWALKLRKRIKEFTPKIIISLPFLSIIEQTDNEYKKFLGNLYKKHKDRLYMPRYSIADFKYKDGVDGKERSDNSVDFFLNIWNSEIIVTTFDQLLYSVFSLKSKHLMRFHNLFNSIIIFDEIQALPSELWKPFEFFFKKLSEVGNTHIVLMSATQPRFMPDAIERVPSHEKYFTNRKRVLLKIESDRKLLVNFIEDKTDFLNKHSNKSLMIVLNTKNSSKFVYKKIKQLIEEKKISERPIINFSSLVAPSQRTNRLIDIKNFIDNNNYPVVVTTQCIEAGVDIDMDYIIRDWAPLDSVFQVCGRCNRNGEKGKSDVLIIDLISEKNKRFSDMIYDDILLGCTARSISGNQIIPEEKFYEFGKQYFDLIRPLLGQSMKIVKAYSEYSHKYNDKEVNIKKLLRGEMHQEQFIIPSLDKDLPNEIIKALKIEDRWKRRYAIKRLRKRISANSVSINFEKWMPYNADDFTNEKIGNFRIINKQFYDKKGVGLDLDKFGKNYSDFCL